MAKKKAQKKTEDGASGSPGAGARPNEWGNPLDHVEFQEWYAGYVAEHSQAAAARFLGTTTSSLKAWNAPEGSDGARAPRPAKQKEMKAAIDSGEPVDGGGEGDAGADDVQSSSQAAREASLSTSYAERLAVVAQLEGLAKEFDPSERHPFYLVMALLSEPK